MPNLDSIMERERRLIKLQQLKRMEKDIPTIKTKSGKTVKVPYLKPRPINGEGCSITDGIPTRPELDFTKYKRKRGDEK